MQKLLKVMSSTSAVLVAALALVHSAEARSKGHNHRSPTPAVEQRTMDKATGAQSRDPSDIALEKKIKSICRGC
ncbi:hypothetical protein [Bradyrhizobium sp. B117]|uniref:hypothetical protein n=1 Tax=Bradyrhizobium sp. B117 TaxID=3140246 RepID=UPI003183C518